MSSFFNYDNAVWRAIGKIADCVFLSAFWVFCSLPIFTIGASTTALYYATNKALRNSRGYVWSEFFHAFKANFKQSTLVWLAVLGVYVVSILDCFFARQLWETIPLFKILFLVFFVVMVFVTMWSLYVFPYIARFENTTKATMKNCVFISVANFPWTLLLLVLFVVAVAAFLFFPIGMLCVPGIYMILANRILERIFKKYMTPEDLEAENLRNGYIYPDTYIWEEKEKNAEKALEEACEAVEAAECETVEE